MTLDDDDAEGSVAVALHAPIWVWSARQLEDCLAFVSNYSFTLVVLIATLNKQKLV